MNSPLRLRYIFFAGVLKKGSVEHKVLSQIRQLKNHGIDVEGIFFHMGVKDESEIATEKLVKAVELPKYQGSHRYFQSHYERQHHFKFAAEYLQSIAEEYDLVFLRHAGNGKGYEEILKAIGNKGVLYIPSNRIREVYCERRYAKDSGLGSAMFSWWAYLRFWIREKRLYRKYLGKLKAVVTFTPEFGKIISSQSRSPIHMIYNRDGADTATVPPRKISEREGEVKLVFLKGSGQEQKWAGLDRLIESIEAHPDIPFRLYITGNAINQKEKYGRPFVTLTGRLPEKELEELIDEVDLGVSNLANYLIHFEETTNLKSRDYYSRGLPFIQSNTMPDIEGTEAASYYLRIPNDDSLIDMKAVHAFALAMRVQKDHPDIMHRFAKQHLDWNVTIGELAQSLRAL